MSEYKSIIKGLKEAVEFEKGNLKNVKVDTVHITEVPHFVGKQIKVIRKNQNMTQEAFSGALGVSKKTIEAWEAGRNTPNGPAQRILGFLKKDKNFLENNEIITRA